MPKGLLARLFTTRYRPDAGARGFLERAQTQQDPLAEVTLAAPDPHEAALLFGVHLSRKGVQPVHLRIANRSNAPLRLQMLGLDPSYFTPLEVASVSRFSLVKGLSALGALAFVFAPILLLLAPSRLITAWRANRRMEDCFRSQALPLRPIPPGATSEGFAFVTYEAGARAFKVRLLSAGGSIRRGDVQAGATAAEFAFQVSVAGIKADHVARDFGTEGPTEECDVAGLIGRLRKMPAATGGRKGRGTGDPANLVVIAEFETLLGAFADRWNETETITLATCAKTARAFLLGSEYRYSPVSPLHLFGRSQDVALQRIRSSIHERLHLRLWRTPLRFERTPVWVGQVSRDIGVRFTLKTWNLSTHRIDPDVDESREYVVEDLLNAGRVEAMAYVDGVGACTAAAPRRNLTGDPYFTDGRRAVLYLSPERTTPRFVSFD
ncbi:MAG TPA: LssY C-terminal domain-containing protein [Planctomycetota bacterium]|nr:LssY C-terminal domain-containing protein [Planctomycetota bacterium]